MKSLLATIVFSTSLVLLTGCEPSEFREGKVFAGGKYVSAATLNKGKQIYMEYCMACHGEKGDGKGDQADAEKNAKQSTQTTSNS